MPEIERKQFYGIAVYETDDKKSVKCKSDLLSKVMVMRSFWFQALYVFEWKRNNKFQQFQLYNMFFTTSVAPFINAMFPFIILWTNIGIKR